MTYNQANAVLVSDLSPDSRCISKGVGKANGADWKDTQDHVSAMTEFINRNGGSALFPDSRLMPVEAIVNGAPFEKCSYPLDDKLMDMKMEDHTDDAGAVGYTYEVTDIIYGDEITSDSQKWLRVVPRTLGEALVRAQLWDPLTDTYSPAVSYYNDRAGDATFMSTRHEAKVRYRCTKNGDFVENSNTQMKDACETFIVTVQCGNNNSQYDASFTGATGKTLLISPNYSGTNGAVCEYAVEASGVDAYWKSSGVVGDTSSPSMISVSSGGISINFGQIGQEQGTGNVTFTVYGNWTGNTSSLTGLPVVPNRSSNTVTFGVSITGANESAQTFKSSITAASNLNMDNANKEDIASRCSVVMTIVYNSSDGTVNITKGNGGGISPLFYPSTISQGGLSNTFAWLDEGITSRRYDAVEATRSSATISVESNYDYTIDKMEGSDVPIQKSGNSFTIDFSGTPSASQTFRYRLKQVSPSPEYADIAITINE